MPHSPSAHDIFHSLYPDGPKRYQVLDVVSRGGTIRVFRATDTTDGNLVAIKPPDLHNPPSKERQRRWRREVTILSQFRHRNAPVFRALEESGNGDYLLVMEWLDGETLESHLRAHPSPDSDHMMGILAQLFSVVEAFHAQGLIHRDLSSSNLFLTNQLLETHPLLKLLDYGLSRLATVEPMELTITKIGQVVGTPRYMSPEQVVGDHVSIASDIYAIGILMYEMFMGVHPFASLTTSEVLHAQLMEPLPRLTHAAAQIPGLQAAIDGCTVKQPLDRLQNIKSVAEILQMRRVLATDTMG